MLRTRLKTAYAQLHAHMKHRSDLGPGLIELAKPAFKDDLSPLQGLAGARIPARRLPPRPILKRLPSRGETALFCRPRVAGRLQKFFLSAEEKPDLRSQSLFLDLKLDLAQTDQAIANARETYNQTVGSYNAADATVSCVDHRPSFRLRAWPSRSSIRHFKTDIPARTGTSRQGLGSGRGFKLWPYSNGPGQ